MTKDCVFTMVASLRAAFSYGTKSSSDSQTQRKNKDETKFDNFYYLYQNNKSDTNTFLFNKWSVTKKMRYKRRRANPTQPKNKSGPGGITSHTGVPSQPLPNLEPSILPLIRTSS